VVATALKRIGPATKFFITRFCERTPIGPYVVTTTEVRRSEYKTTVTWGEGGPEVELFGSAVSFDQRRAEGAHTEICALVEEATGLARVPLAGGLPPAA
jgi:hypothetical protein